MYFCKNILFSFLTCYLGPNSKLVNVRRREEFRFGFLSIFVKQGFLKTFGQKLSHLKVGKAEICLENFNKKRIKYEEVDCPDILSLSFLQDLEKSYHIGKCLLRN